jgi:ABC-type multidrug transport system fused ATPase/permease subunit
MFYIRFLPTVLLFFGILILAIITDVRMTIASLAPLPFIGYFLYRFGEKASEIQRTITDLWDK